jgi:aspartate/methionine/tyrosine aminotransferase
MLWEQRGITLRPPREILPLPDLRQGLILLPLALLDPGDKVLLPDLANPLYRVGSALSGAAIETYPLWERNDYLPNLGQLEKLASRAKLLILNYPHNPTGTVADPAFFKELIGFAQIHNLFVLNDFSYGGWSSDATSSLLELSGAKGIGGEIGALLPPGDLLSPQPGYLAGNRELVSALGALLREFSPAFGGPLLRFSWEALRGYDLGRKARSFISERVDLLSEELYRLGWRFRRPVSTPFVWLHTPGRYTSRGFVHSLFRRSRILIVSGPTYGERGEGFLRISLTPSLKIIGEAISSLHMGRRLHRHRP